MSGFSLQVGVFWLSGLQFCFCTLWDLQLRLFTSANCEVFSDFSLLVRTVRLPTFLFCFLNCWNEALRLRSLKQVVKSCRDSVCKLEFFGCLVFSSASVPCGICNCACSLRQTEVFSDFILLVRTVRLPTFLLFFGLCRTEALRLRSLKQIVKFCRASVCKLELWLSGPQFCFYTLWDLQLHLFTSANCEVFSDFSLLVRTVRLLSFLFFGLCWNEALRLRSLKQVVKSCRDSVCKLEFFGCPVFSSASVPCGICNCACSLRRTEVFSDFSLLVRTVRLPTFLFCFLNCWNEALRLRSLKQVVKSCRDSVCKLEFFGCPVFSSASVPCGICNCACSLRQTEVFSDFSLLVRTVRLPTFLLFFGLCRNEALRLRSLKQIVKFCRASVCKLELWLSGPQFCFYTLWDLQLRLFTSANCEVFSDFSLLVKTVRLLCFLDYVGMKHCGFVLLSKL